MKKIKILILNEPENINGVTYWRMYHPMMLLQGMYPDRIEIIWNRGIILPTDYLQADVAIAWRPCLPQQIAVMDEIKKLGIPIILDFDDDTINIPTGSPAYRTIMPNRDNILAAVNMASLVWVTNHSLKKTYGHPNTHIVPNAIHPDDIPASPTPLPASGKPHIMWRGDWFQYDDVIHHLHWYKGLVKQAQLFTWYGFMPNYKHPDNAIYVTYKDLPDYFESGRSMFVNYLWKPMRLDVEFNEGKSNIAKLEALMFGGVCIGNWNHRSEWAYTTDRLLNSEAELHGLWEQCRDEAIRKYNIVDATHLRMQTLSALF